MRWGFISATQREGSPACLFGAARIAQFYLSLINHFSVFPLVKGRAGVPHRHIIYIWLLFTQGGCSISFAETPQWYHSITQSPV